MKPYDTEFTVRMHRSTMDTIHRLFPLMEVSVVCRKFLMEKIKAANPTAYYELLEDISGHGEAKPLVVPNPKALLGKKTKDKKKGERK